MADAQATCSLAAANKDHWDRMAGVVFEQEWVKVLSDTIRRALQTYAGLIGLNKDKNRSSPVRILDYACGDGLAAWALAPYADICVGMDISEGMVTQFNKRVKEAGISADVMSALQGDVLNPSPALSDPSLHDFDAVVTTMALHHFPQPRDTVTALVQRLRPGGTIAIVDWVPKKDGPLSTKNGAAHENPMHQILNHEDLSAENVLGMLEGAGCDVATAYYVVLGEKGHVPEEVAKTPGGIDGHPFLAFAKKK